MRSMISFARKKNNTKLNNFKNMPVKIKIIKTEAEYNEMLSYVEALADRADFETNQELVDEFEVLTALINMYDKEHYVLPAGDPIEIINLKMSYMGLTRKDLLHIASSGVLSDVFNRKRSLSKQMIREFSKLLDIDQSLLNVDYSEGSDEVSIAPSIVQNKVSKVIREASPFIFINRKSKELEKFKMRVKTQGMLLNICPS